MCQYAKKINQRAYLLYNKSWLCSSCQVGIAIVRILNQGGKCKKQHNQTDTNWAFEDHQFAYQIYKAPPPRSPYNVGPVKAGTSLA